MFAAVLARPAAACPDKACFSCRDSKENYQCQEARDLGSWPHPSPQRGVGTVSCHPGESRLVPGAEKSFRDTSEGIHIHKLSGIRPQRLWKGKNPAQPCPLQRSSAQGSHYGPCHFLLIIISCPPYIEFCAFQSTLNFKTSKTKLTICWGFTVYQAMCWAIYIYYLI